MAAPNKFVRTQGLVPLTDWEIRLIETGNALARSLGHRPELRCPKISSSVPCVCGAAQEQAKALGDWQQLIEEIKPLT